MELGLALGGGGGVHRTVFRGGYHNNHHQINIIDRNEQTLLYFIVRGQSSIGSAILGSDCTVRNAETDVQKSEFSAVNRIRPL